MKTLILQIAVAILPLAFIVVSAILAQSHFATRPSGVRQERTPHDR
jgi:hypothetical protein